MSDMKVTVKPIGIFDGVALSVLVTNDLTYFLASEVSRALGYASDRRVTDFVRGKWAGEFPDPDDVLEPVGKVAITVKQAFEDTGSSRRSAYMFLSEAAVLHVAHLSGLPRAAAFGAWVTSAVQRSQVPDLLSMIRDLQQRCERLEAIVARPESQTGQGGAYSLQDAQGALCAQWWRDLGSTAKTYQEIFRWLQPSMELQGLARLVCGAEFKSVTIRNWLKAAVWREFTAPDGQKYSIQESDGPRYWVRKD